MHWGDEDSFAPNQWQRSLAQMMADNCVDAVIGTHPHVLQEIKWVSRPDGRQTLVAYSLGNFISAQLYADNLIGAFLEFDIVKTAGSVYLENAKITPVVTHYDKRRKNLQVYRFEDYTEKLAESHGCINYDDRFSYKYLKDLVRQNIAPEFLSDFYK
jgi:poly-gamma-glutamate synthesis protein (capsule biosynthesis protein)